MKSICPKCLRKKRLRHEVFAVEEERKDVLLRIIESVQENLREKMNTVITVKEDVMKKSENCITNLKRRREEMIGSK